MTTKQWKVVAGSVAVIIATAVAVYVGDVAIVAGVEVIMESLNEIVKTVIE